MSKIKEDKLPTESLMNRLVNIFMIIIVVSCPLRCMVQGCGCFSPVESCCAFTLSPELTRVDSAALDCCCTEDEDSHNTPPPQKCQCNCFCSGVILADDFVLTDDQSSQPLIQNFATAALESDYQDALVSEAFFNPPDSLANGFPGNPGRQLRCLINSFVI